jgi:hypothetical protein
MTTTKTFTEIANDNEEPPPKVGAVTWWNRAAHGGPVNLNVEQI